MEQCKRDQAKNTIALFRYGLISSLVNNTYEEKSMEEYYRKVASITYNLNGKEIKVPLKIGILITKNLDMKV